MSTVGGTWEVHKLAPLTKMNLRRIIGLRSVQFKLRLFESIRCTWHQSAVSSTAPQSLDIGSRHTATMPVDLNGYWKMISNDNFEEYLKALGE